MNDNIWFLGVKGVVCGPEGAWFADVYWQNSGNATYSCQVPYIHVHFMAPGQLLWRLRHVGGGKRVHDTLVRAGQLRETTLTGNIGPPGLLGVQHRADNPTPDKKHCDEI
jgi:hypothetical protein